MKNKKNLGFIIGVVVLVIILLGAMAFLSKRQEVQVVSQLPSFDTFNKSYTGKIGDFNLQAQPALGNSTAPVKIVEFGDFKCPACAMWEESVFPSLYKDYIQPGKVQFHFINFPFLGQDSILAAMAGEDIYSLNPDAFWEFYAKIYQNQGSETQQWATEDFLLKFVKENVSGIDYKKFETLLKEKKNMDIVREDFMTGQKYGVNSTPTIFINGVKMDDNRYPAIQNAINKDLKGAK